MGIRFSPGCACCHRVLFWINEYYFQIYHVSAGTGIYTPSTYYTNRGIQVDSWVPELNQINADVNSVNGGAYTGDITDYDLVFWYFPTPPLPTWFNDIISTNPPHKARVIILTSWFQYRLTDVDFYMNSGIFNQTEIALIRTAYGANASPLLIPPGTSENHPLMAGVQSLDFPDFAAPILPEQSINILSKAKNLNQPNPNLPWLASAQNNTFYPDWVVSGNVGFIYNQSNNLFVFLDNLLNYYP